MKEKSYCLLCCVSFGHAGHWNTVTYPLSRMFPCKITPIVAIKQDMSFFSRWVDMQSWYSTNVRQSLHLDVSDKLLEMPLHCNSHFFVLAWWSTEKLPGVNMASLLPFPHCSPCRPGREKRFRVVGRTHSLWSRLKVAAICTFFFSLWGPPPRWHSQLSTSFRRRELLGGWTQGL